MARYNIYLRDLYHYTSLKINYHGPFQGHLKFYVIYELHVLYNLPVLYDLHVFYDLPVLYEQAQHVGYTQNTKFQSLQTSLLFIVVECLQIIGASPSRLLLQHGFLRGDIQVFISIIYCFLFQFIYFTFTWF